MAKVKERLAAQSEAVKRNAGIYTTPADHRQLAGYDSQGNPVYMTSALRDSVDTGYGSRMIQTMKDALDPMGTFSEGSDADLFDQIGTVASNGQFLLQLDALKKNGDTKGFIGAIASKFNVPLQNQFSDPQTKGGIGTAFSAYNLMEYWDKMSPAQKSLGVAGLGINAYKFASGDNLATKVLAGGDGIHPALTVGDSLSFLQTGINSYDLVKNWDQYSTMQKVLRGGQTAADVASVAQKYFLNDTAKAQGQELLARQFTDQAVKQGIEQGTSQVAGQAAAEGGTTAAAELGTGEVLGSVASGIGGGLMTYQGLKTVKDGWGKGGNGNRTSGAVNGALGGAAIAGGLAMMGVGLGPIGIAAIIAVSVAGNMTKVGKHIDQVARDNVRNVFKQSGLMSEDNKVALAGGELADIGIDGQGGKFQFADRSKLTKENQHLEHLNAYDTDYTNDLDFAASMGGMTLSRLSTGGKNTAIDQMGSQLGNASIKNTKGREFTEENFNIMTANQRAMFNKQGIATRLDAEKLAKAAHDEGRINDIDYTSAMQSFNMIFDNDYKTAKDLMLGRWKGVEVASQEANAQPKGAAPLPDASADDMSKAEKNKLIFASQNKAEFQKIQGAA